MFDLAVLLARPDAAALVLDEAAGERLDDAIEHAMAISFDEYVSKVVTYLEPGHAEACADRATWNALQEDVVARLGALR